MRTATACRASSAHWGRADLHAPLRPTARLVILATRSTGALRAWLRPLRRAPVRAPEAQPPEAPAVRARARPTRAARPRLTRAFVAHQPTQLPRFCRAAGPSAATSSTGRAAPRKRTGKYAGRVRRSGALATTSRTTTCLAPEPSPHARPRARSTMGWSPVQWASRPRASTRARRTDESGSLPVDPKNDAVRHRVRRREIRKHDARRPGRDLDPLPLRERRLPDLDVKRADLLDR